MSKGPSEDIFRKALGSLDLEPTFIFKPSDVGHASNAKPCDFMVWFPDSVLSGEPMGRAVSAWFEVKETTNLGVFPMGDLRPSQVNGILTARRLGFPYFLAIRWKSGGMWSLVDAVRLLDWWHGHGGEPAPAAGSTLQTKGVARTLLESRFGVSSSPGQLAAIIKIALIEGL